MCECVATAAAGGVCGDFAHPRFFFMFLFYRVFFFTEFHSSLLITDDDLIDDGSPWRKTKSIDNNTHTHTHTKEIMITLSDKCVAMATRRTCQTKMDRYRDDFTGPLVFFCLICIFSICKSISTVLEHVD